MKRTRAYFLFFLAIVLLSSLGVEAEKAVRNVKVEFAMSHSLGAATAAPADQRLVPVRINEEQ